MATKERNFRGFKRPFAELHELSNETDTSHASSASKIQPSTPAEAVQRENKSNDQAKVNSSTGASKTDSGPDVSSSKRGKKTNNDTRRKRTRIDEMKALAEYFEESATSHLSPLTLQVEAMVFTYSADERRGAKERWISHCNDV
jgi:hypothetical protein